MPRRMEENSCGPIPRLYMVEHNASRSTVIALTAPQTEGRPE